MGEEWGASTPWQFFTSHPEPELGTATAEGRIREFEKMGWDPAVVPDPQAPSTFTDSKLDWSELQSGDHARLLSVYRALARLRAEHPEFTDPRFTAIDVDFDEDARWFVLHRATASIVINFAATEQELPLSGRVLLAPDAATALTPTGIWLPGHSAVILAR